MGSEPVGRPFGFLLIAGLGLCLLGSCGPSEEEVHQAKERARLAEVEQACAEQHQRWEELAGRMPGINEEYKDRGHVRIEKLCDRARAGEPLDDLLTGDLLDQPEEMEDEEWDPSP